MLEKKGVSYSHSAVLYEIPLENANAIVRWGKDKIKNDKLYEEDPSMGREDHTHVTVKYGLTTIDPKKIEDIVCDVEPFEIELGDVILFKQPEYHVVVIKVKGPKLHQLHKKISKLKNVDKWPTYRPHITVAYVQPGTADHLNGNKKFNGTKITVDKVQFASSDGKKKTIKLNG